MAMTGPADWANSDQRDAMETQALARRTYEPGGTHTGRPVDFPTQAPRTEHGKGEIVDETPALVRRIPDPEKRKELPHLSSVAVVGVTFCPGYPDTFHRLWLGCEEGQGRASEECRLIRLDREPDNKFDPNAVAVYSHFLKQRIGYLPKGLAVYYAEHLDLGLLVWACLAQVRVRQDAPEKPGVDILILVAEDEKQLHEVFLDPKQHSPGTSPFDAFIPARQTSEEV